MDRLPIATHIGVEVRGQVIELQPRSFVTRRRMVVNFSMPIHRVVRPRPKTRYPLAPSFVSFSEPAGEDSPAEAWSSTALELLEKGTASRRIPETAGLPVPAQELQRLARRGARLLDQLLAYPDPAVAALAAAEKHRLASDIDRQRKWETAHDRTRTSDLK